MFFTKNLAALLIHLVTASNCANILFVTPIPSVSHHILHKVLALELVKKGHNVTMLTHETEKKPPPENYTLITMVGVYEALGKVFDMNELITLEPVRSIQVWSEFMLVTTEFDYQTDGFKALWNYPKNFKFDVIICDSSIGRYTYIFNERFHNPPTIALIPFLLPATLQASFGSLPMTVYDPHYITEYTADMTLKQRAYNLFITLYDMYYVYWVHQPREEGILAKNYPKIQSTLDELESRVALVLCNTDPLLDYPKIIPPNIITIGGLHAKASNPLPKDLQEIMDRATSGVVLFSLGTNLRSDKLDPKVMNSILKSFSKLKQTVLWKFESELKNLPKNVIVRKWLPQNDIMGHPNIKLFINHGGALSTQEALYHGIPLIQIPFFADQRLNAAKTVFKKIGVKVDLNEINEKVFDDALDKVLNDESYARNVKALSVKFRDQPQTALEKSVFWIEYLIRNGNPEHLSAPTRNMPFYKILHLDILGILLSFFTASSVLILLLLQKCRRIVCRRSKEKVKKN